MTINCQLIVTAVKDLERLSTNTYETTVSDL